MGKSFPRCDIRQGNLSTLLVPTSKNSPPFPVKDISLSLLLSFWGANQASELFIGNRRKEFGEHQCVSSLRLGGRTPSSGSGWLSSVSHASSLLEHPYQISFPLLPHLSLGSLPLLSLDCHRKTLSNLYFFLLQIK